MTDEHEPKELDPEAAELEMHEQAEAEPAEAEPQTVEEEAPAAPAHLERLQKILAQAGIASRRHAEELITEGRVQVNGQVVTTLGTKADPARDHIRVDGKLLQGAERQRYFMLNKPKGYVTTVSDPEGRPTVMEFFARMGERLYPVGRLDYLSEGLLLVTNDGELAHTLTRAASGVEKTYLVKVAGQPAEEDLERLRTGVAIERGKLGEGKVRTAPARIHQVRAGDNPWFEVVLIEGRNRELRKMFEEIGHHVEKIRRVGYGPLVLDLEPGKLRELEPDEVAALRLAAEGKLKPRRVKTKDLLPKEAGRPASQRFDRGGARRPQRGTEKPNRMRAEGGSERPFRQKQERREPAERPRPENKFGREERPRREGQYGRGFGERRDERGPRPGGRPGFGKPAFGRPTRENEGERPRFSAERPGKKPLGKGFAPRGDKPAEGRGKFERPSFAKGPGKPPGRGFDRGPGKDKPEFRGAGRPRIEIESVPEDRPSGGQGRGPAFGGKSAGPGRPAGGGFGKGRDERKPQFGRSEKPAFEPKTRPEGRPQTREGGKPAFGGRPGGPGKSGFRGKPGGARRPGGKPFGKPGGRPGGKPGGKPGGRPGGRPSGGPRGKGRG